MTKKPSNKTASTFRAFSRISACVSIAVGCAVFAGWWLNIPVLKSIHTDWTAMKVNTALCFVLLGISLFLQSMQESKYPRLHEKLGCALALIVTLIGSLTLAEYIFGWNLCIDQLLYREQASDVLPGRMAPNTALNFLLLGLSLMFLNLNVKGRYPSQFFSLAAAMIGSIALLGYIYDASFLHGMAQCTNMAINTAVAFVLISYGSLCARPDNGLMIPLVSDSPGGFMLRRLVPPTVGIAVVLGSLVLRGEKAGLYDIALGAAILIILIVLAFTALIWLTSLSLHKMDAERKRVEKALQDSNEREHHIAETLQKALIPQQGCYHISGCEVVLKYEPALKEAEVGGDFYDAFEIEEGKIGILIGDVAGKGLMAAMRVAAARHAIRSYAYLDPKPSQVLSLANDALYKERTDEVHMLTAFFAVVDASTGTVTYASGGHESPMVVQADGKVEHLDETGLALGIVPGFPYTQSTRKLEYGDKVVLFTDGITEARIGDNLFDYEGVQNCLIENRCMPMDTIASALLNAAKNHAGGILHDDSAIVVFGLSANEAVVTEEIVLEIWNKDEELAMCRHVVEEAAIKAGFTGEDLWDIISAVFEAAANAVTHGDRKNGRPVTLSVRTTDLFFQAIIQDSGEGFKCPEMNPIPSPVSPRGRGVPLMKAFMDEVRFENDNGCKVILTKYLRNRDSLKSDRVSTDHKAN